ncbi:MAG: transketolase [Candidatus Caenarcaniphilales bacterium]|jgi:transketolase|nr:transketolase [Candidatus Caenarcaniphilales bacterium]
MNTHEIKHKANQIRINSLKMIHRAKSGHPGGSLSIADILSVLYFGGHMKYDPKNPEWADRDILIVSKGHSSPAVYSALGLAGFFKIEDTLSFRSLGSSFQGHIDRMKVAGVEISTGSLGHGLSNALGMALAARLDSSPKKIFAILSDGELQEGSSWEAIMAAAHYQASNLIAFVDRNRIQLDGYTEKTMGLDPLSDKFKAFNWEVIECDGHDIAALNSSLEQAYTTKNKPTVIIANTIKGSGVSFMADQVKWHGVAPNDEDLAKAVKELEALV